MAEAQRDIENSKTVRDFVTALACTMSVCTCPELGVLLHTDGHGSILDSEWGHLPDCPVFANPDDAPPVQA
ncbi:hypothetical protein [Cellulomonas alba]|uniref:Uncharacterized protein n=1 Tax=Cellulomonas alba TaxID=3053467 RepID=A0ABT7SBY9_9CELL|nr:hypothetical protein [Cellulomonas alba]MDM7853702.1 hypothetical protein [Cellulomonas alba]